MFKKSILTVVILLSGLQAHACTITYFSSSSKVDDVISKNGGWNFDNFAIVCGKLERANAGLLVKGQSVVLDNKSIAYGSVSVMGTDAPILGNSFGGSSIKTDSYASQDKADLLLYDAINNAINSMDIDKALVSLNDARKVTKAAYKK